VKPMFGRRKGRLATVLMIGVALAAGMVACGEEEDAQTLTFTLTEKGKAWSLNGPRNAETGVAGITLKNEGKKNRNMQLVRIEGDHSPEEVSQAFGQAGGSEAFPPWFFGGGGISTTPAGRSDTVTQVLEPGTYYAFVTEGGGRSSNPNSIPTIEVKGEASDEALEADVAVSAFEYGFEVEKLPAGQTEIAFENTGDQPHHLLASRLVGESTAEDVERFFKTEKGKSPLRRQGGQSTAVIEGGESQLVTIDLEPGRYALYCFISDRQGGPSHALRGMVDEVEVVGG
jgi:hypothetical protein